MPLPFRPAIRAVVMVYGVQPPDGCLRGRHIVNPAPRKSASGSGNRIIYRGMS